MSHDPHDDRVRQFAPDPFWKRAPLWVRAIIYATLGLAAVVATVIAITETTADVVITPRPGPVEVP